MYPVVIEKSSFFTIATSCIEVFNRETTGFLFGRLKYRKLQKRSVRAMVLEAAYPFQSAMRKPSEVEVVNLSAFGRVEAAMDSMGYEIIGEYHSHPNWKAKLSKSDLGYAADSEKELCSKGYRREGKAWLELVVSISRREYENPHQIGWSFHDYANKAGAVFTLNEFVGYKLTFAAFWLARKNDRMVPHEAQVFIPWWKGYWSK